MRLHNTRFWVIAWLAAMPVTSIAQNTRQPVSRATTQELIDRLQDVSNDEFSLRTNIIAMGGDGKAPMPQGLLKMQDTPIKPAAAMAELVRRGADSVPPLVAHLGDERKTKATIKGIDAITYAAEFDWNLRAGETKPKGVSRYESFETAVNIVGKPDLDHYNPAVGDVCLNLIGEIVNRNYRSLRYQPSAIVIVNSPVLCPDLKDAVTRQWGHLTGDELRKSLVNDVKKPDFSGRANSAVRILARYFPDDLPDAIRKRFGAPLFDAVPIDAFAQNTLYTTADPAARENLMTQFIATNGPSSKDGLILQLWEDKFYKVGDHEHYPTPSPIVKVEPKKILEKFVPHPDADYPPAVDSADFRDISDFIHSLRGIESPGIDQIVWEEFQKQVGRHDKEWWKEDLIAEACIKRLVHKGHDLEFTAFCKRRFGEVEGNNGAKSRIQTLIDGLSTGSFKEEP